ncbi:MAG: tetratricopeptide repeat protein [Nitrospiraceae bacterium]|jgi:hypothetical protein|nr:tetratricopeptide repeat protein [Nitrospiraceae bacterium]
MPTANLWQASGLPEQQYPVVSVLRVEDAIASPEQQKDSKSLGQDLAQWAFPFPIVVVKYYQYQTDRDRTEVIQDGLTSGLTKMGLPAISFSKASLNPLRTFPDGHLVLHTKLLSFKVTNDLKWLITVLLNTGGLQKLNAQVTLDCRLLKPGQAAPVWQGVVEGKATWDTGGRYINEQSEKWEQERSTVLRAAIEDAVGNLIAKSGMKQLRTRLQTKAYAKHMKTGQEREAAGKWEEAVSHYGKAYGTAAAIDQSLAAIQAVAQLVRKPSVKPKLSEEVRRYWIQAKSFGDMKQYGEAIILYDRISEAAPWWAEAHFNRAVILANQTRYQEAMTSMKQFLILAPNSPDAREAQDKIYLWELGRGDKVGSGSQ